MEKDYRSARKTGDPKVRKMEGQYSKIVNSIVWLTIDSHYHKGTVERLNRHDQLKSIH